jgi:hypothetical protein
MLALRREIDVYHHLGRATLVHPPNGQLHSVAIAEASLPGGSRPTVSKVGRAQIVRPPATAYVNSGSRGAYFVAVGVKGIQEA